MISTEADSRRCPFMGRSSHWSLVVAFLTTKEGVDLPGSAGTRH